MWRALKRRLFRTAWWQRHGKNRRETDYWRQNADKMVQWYLHREPFRLPYPDESILETRFDLRKNAVMTYVRAETERASYLGDLMLCADSFSGLTVADIGSGPMPTLDVFDDCRRFCVDHLIDVYREIGYPLDEYEPETTFVNAKSERLPFADGSFDVVLSRNALDHVDDFSATCGELRRVLRPGGWLHVQLHYHEPTSTEPQQLNDQIVRQCLQVEGLRKVRQEHGSWGFADGSTVVWSNVPVERLSGTESDLAPQPAAC